MCVRLNVVQKLDEVQTFGLVKNYQDQSPTFDFEDNAIPDLFEHFFDDRIRLIRCLSALLRIRENGNHPYHAPASEVMNQLLRDGLASVVLEGDEGERGKGKEKDVIVQQYVQLRWVVVAVRTSELIGCVAARAVLWAT